MSFLKQKRGAARRAHIAPLIPLITSVAGSMLSNANSSSSKNDDNSLGQALAGGKVLQDTGDKLVLEIPKDKLKSDEKKEGGGGLLGGLLNMGKGLLGGLLGK